MVKRMRRILLADWWVRIQHVFREANKVADHFEVERKQGLASAKPKR